MKKKPSFIYLFYFLVGYILVQFFWWAYLLINLSVELITAKAPFNGYSDEDVLLLSKSKTWMILGEGSVFILLLAIGLYQIRKSIIREVALAQQQQNFMMAVTHELKSPLAAIKLQLQTVLKRENLSSEQRNELLQNATADTDRLVHLTENILTATNIEQTKINLHIESIQLNAFLKSIIQPYVVSSQANIELSIEDHITVMADRNALNSVITNLIDNSLKYANKNGRICISGEVKQVKTYLLIEDEGPGFKNSDAKQVFEQFYRGGNELTRIAKGTGLGLFIVKQLLQKMQGDIQIQTNNTKGASLLITLPLAKN
ncbi:MAG: two-component system phosphate regulon sensor histidine kinase PhoR [Flavobacteriales bacterium]